MKISKTKKMYLYSLTICVMMFIGLSNVMAADSATATTYIKCGDSLFPAPLATIIRSFILLLQIIVPVGIIIMGSLDFLKATIAGDAEKMKKNQKQFVTRLIAGAITFFIFVILKFVVSIFAGADSSENFTSCLDCLINDEDSCTESSSSPFDSSVPDDAK